MGMGRVVPFPPIAARARLAAVVVAAVLLSARAFAATPVLRGVVDSDDDDGNGLEDGRQLTNVPLVDTLAWPAGVSTAGQAFRAVAPEANAVRVLVDGAPVVPGTRLPAEAARVALQPVMPGRFEVTFTSVKLDVRAVAISAVDGSGRSVDLTRSHASFQRTPPDRVDNVTDKTGDPDALRYVFIGPAEDLPNHARVASRSEAGLPVDQLARVKLVDVTCPHGVSSGTACRSTWPIRVVADAVDQGHPLVADRSIRAELGGGLVISAPGIAQQIRVAGPRRSQLGIIGRYRAHLRLTIVRTFAGGAPSLAGRDRAARAMGVEQIKGATAAWGQCGISFGPVRDADIRLVDPPPPFLAAIGCDLGFPSSGGRIRLVVDGSELEVETTTGKTPSQVARSLARKLQAQGFRVVTSPNARIGPGAFRVVDLLVYRSDGRPASLSAPEDGEASTDQTMPVCIGRVDLGLGLRHFLDVDSMAGTVQERTLLKWVDDQDPGTLDAVIFPAFEGGGRIGESFIGNDRSSLRNLVLVDRAGVAASLASHTLAHELGHVLLDVPGHPDDYGVDQPTLLMDSDAANGSAFGPRRLTVAECERAIRQSGPGAPAPALEPWPLAPLPKQRTP